MANLRLIYLFISLACVTSIFAKEMPILIKDYTEASELSIKTKNENSGNLIVYTRDDLQRMQALTLKDILKTLRYFSYSQNRLAQADMLNLDAFSNHSKGIRLYLNEHELLSPIYGSGFSIFGDMELEFIDHIEIYTGFPSFEFGIAPASVVIRLYTKSAGHDEGGKLKLMGGSYGSSLASAYYTDQREDFSYFTYIGQYDNNRESYDHKGSSLDRDELRTRFYGSLSSQNHSLEVQAVQSDNDAFLGSINQSPLSTKQVIDNSLEYKYISISTHSEFMDKSLKVNASFISNDSEFDEAFDLPDLSIKGRTYKKKTEEDSFTLLGEKKWQSKEHDLSLGLQYRYKYFDISDESANGITTPFTQVFDTEQVYSLYLQDVYSLNENHRLILSVMGQMYRRNANVDEPNNSQLRLGYIYEDEALTAKTTLSSQSFAAEPYMMIDSRDGNTNLESERYNSLTQELSYAGTSTINNLVLSYARLSEYPLIGSSGRWENSNEDLDILTTSYAFTYLYSQKDKLEFQLNYSNSDTAYTEDKAKTLSSLLRSLNSIGKFDIFNEFWIIDPAFTSSIRIDYSAGVKYRITKDFSLELKGENIFDRSQNRVYVLDPKTNQVSSLRVDVIDPKVWFGLEYLF